MFVSADRVNFIVMKYFMYAIFFSLTVSCQDPNKCETTYNKVFTNFLFNSVKVSKKKLS